MNGQKKGFKFNMRNMLILFSMIPLLVAVIALTIISVVKSESNLEEQTKESLKVAAYDLKEYYEYDIKNATGPDGWINYDTEYVDHLTNDGINLTVFKGDTRFVTSLKNADGSRNEGTTCNADIWVDAQARKDYYSNSVQIGGVDYFVYYTPMADANGTVVGMAFAGKSCEAVNKAKMTVLWTSIIAALIVIAIFVVLVIILAKKVVAPFTTLTDSLSDMSEGDMSVTRSTSSALSETSILIESSKKLQQNVSKMLRAINDSSMELYEKVTEVAKLSEEADSGTSQISNAVSELADGASSMADNVQNINAQVVDLGELIESISDSVATLSTSANKMNAANNDASQYILDMENSSNETVEAVQSIKSKVEGTNEAVKKISEAVDMITGIASQTNLLALNASIEAARAGEAGRGFAVVATEIGALADQSNSSANDIKQIVENIIQQSTQSVAASNLVENAIANEQEILASTKEKFGILNAEINNSVSEVNAITSQVQGIENIKNAIIENVSDLSAISEENAASSEEVAASVSNIANGVQIISQDGEDMKNIAGNLTEMVKRFKF